MDTYIVIKTKPESWIPDKVVQKIPINFHQALSCIFNHNQPPNQLIIKHLNNGIFNIEMGRNRYFIIDLKEETK